MILKRTMDATFLNSVAAHPDVKPTIGPLKPEELTKALLNSSHVALQAEHGGFIGIKLADGVYECHSLFLPEGRGAYAVEAMREGLRYLFTRTDCMKVVTKVPEGNKAAFGAARIMGFSNSFVLDRGWPLEDGSFGKVSVMSLSLEKWTSMDAVCASKGEWFHQRLEELTEEMGCKIPVHYEEPAHNRAAGAAVQMYAAGNPVKATATYNMWARQAGFPQIVLMSEAPTMIDMSYLDEKSNRRLLVIGLTDGDMEVVLCQ